MSRAIKRESGIIYAETDSDTLDLYCAAVPGRTDGLRESGQQDVADHVRSVRRGIDFMCFEYYHARSCRRLRDDLPAHFFRGPSDEIQKIHAHRPDVRHYARRTGASARFALSKEFAMRPARRRRSICRVEMMSR